MNQEVLVLIDQLCTEKNLSKKELMQALEQAIAASYKKDYGDRDFNYVANIDLKTGQMHMAREFSVVEDVENEDIEISADDIRAKKNKLNVGDKYLEEIDEVFSGSDFGRIAAMSARQTLFQKIRDIERNKVIDEYSSKIGQIVSASVSRVERGLVFVELGKGQALMPKDQQIADERYYPGMRLKVYLVGVEDLGRGSQIVVSRSHPNLIRQLFEMEVPEIQEGVVEIVSVARIAGVRTKIAVRADDKSVDPIGTFVGGRGSRVQAVMNEIGEEKIDIIEYSDEVAEYIANSLSPAEISSIELDFDNKQANVIVDGQNKSLAIGKMGQNVRLSSELTGWKLDIIENEQE